MMSHLKMNFGNSELIAADASNASTFNLTCKNNSTSSWVFYVYQTMPNQQYGVFSLAWLAAPYKIAPGAMITFNWTLDTYFVWGSTGMLAPGVNFMASEMQPGDPSGNNMITFSAGNNNPHFSNPVKGGQPGTLVIDESGDISMRNTYATGVGMSRQATFVQQAMANTRQQYEVSTPTYWLAAAAQMQTGAVLSGSSNMAVQFAFQGGANERTATLNADNTWTIS